MNLEQQTRLLRSIQQLLAQIQNDLHALVESTDKDGKPYKKQDVGLPVEITKYYDSEERDRPENNKREKRRLWLELSGVVLAAAIAVFTFLTLRIFRNQLTQMVQSNQNQVRSMRIDDRPWIAWTDYVGWIHFPDPNNFYFLHTLTNVGRTGALNMQVRMNYKIVPKVSGEFSFTESDIQYRPQRMDAIEFNTVKGATLAPGVPWRLQKMYFAPISTAEWHDLLRGNKRFYFWIDVEYDDVFQRHLYTHFCAYYPPGLANPVIGCGFYGDTTPEQ